MTDNTPFFIVGSGRSGTTLLRLILAGHSRIHIPPETWFIEQLVKELPLVEPLDSAQIDRAVDIMITDYRWPDMGIEPADMRRLAHGIKQPKLADIINIVYHHHLSMSGKSRFGDKTPPYISLIPELDTLYPGAKFIHLIRDGRDVAISIIDAQWEGRCYDGDKFEWTRAILHGLAHRDSVYASQILEVRYEDVVTNLEPTVRKICAFIGEEFESSMLDFRQNIDLIPARELSNHRKIGQPMSGDMVEVWKKKISSVECFILEACLYRYLIKLGYPLHFSAPIWRPLLGISGLVLYLLAPLLNRGIPYLQRRNLLPKHFYV